MYYFTHSHHKWIFFIALISKCSFNGYDNLSVNCRLTGTLTDALSYRSFVNTNFLAKFLTEMLTDVVVNRLFVNKFPRHLAKLLT